LLERKGIGFMPKAVTRIDAEGNKLEFAEGEPLAYDYLVITTGPKLSFDEVPGAGPHGGHTHSVCTVDHAQRFWAEYENFLKDPGPIVVGAMPMASCFGPAYEFAFIVDADLRKRKLRHKVPITYVTSEPYIGHLGLGGVGDSKSMLESELRGHDMKWITSARTTKVEAGKLFTTQIDDQGKVLQGARDPVQAGDDAARLQGRRRGGRRARSVQPARLRADRRIPAQQGLQNIFSAGVCVAIPPVEVTPVPTGAPKTGYMIETMISAIVHNIADEIAGKVPETKRDLERDLPGRHGRHRRRLRRPAADPAAQRELVQEGQVGAPGQDRVRKVLHAQDEVRQYRADLRKVCAQGAGHRAPGRQVGGHDTMSSTETTAPQPLTFRRYKDGDAKVRRWQAEIFDADHSHKCPTYIQSTPPCQGSCPSGEDIRGYLNIVRGIEKPPAGMPWQEYAWRRLTEANPLPSVMGRVCPAPCESGCNRNEVEDFVGINSVEHFLGEWAIEHAS
jgi:hypothetical protein